MSWDDDFIFHDPYQSVLTSQDWDFDFVVPALEYSTKGQCTRARSPQPRT